MACGSTVAVIILVIFNIIFVLAGGLMLAFGIAAAVKPESVESILSTFGEEISTHATQAGFDIAGVIRSSAVFMIIMGAIVFIIGIFGCLGACCRNVCMLGTYIAILILIILGEGALIIFAIVYPDKFQTEVQPQMQKTLQQKFDSDGTIFPNGTYMSPTNAVALSWATMQFELRCCGAYGYKDYTGVNFTRLTQFPNATVSISCCKTLSNEGKSRSAADFKNLPDCLSQNPDPSNINDIDCYTQLQELVKQYSKVAIGIAAAIIGIEVILIILAIVICRSQRRDVPKRI